jgi:Ca-activated chloride channel homolog
MKIIFSILLLLFTAIEARSQKPEKYIMEGNEFYRQQQFDKAAELYNKAIAADPQNSTARFNLANAMQRQGKEDEAIQLFTEVAAAAKESELKGKAFYNKGAILSKQKKLEESIEAYKDALRQNPNDKEARENLQKALLELKKKNPPEKKNDQQKKKKDKEPQKKQQPQPKMNQKETEQRLKLLEQKEKEVQQRLQKEKMKAGGSQAKDW